MIKGIIFDYNGVITSGDWYWTLIRSKVSNFEEEKVWFEELANQVDLGNITPDDIKDKLSEKLGMEKSELEAFKEKIELGSSYIREDLVNYIKELKDDYKLALLSNYNASELRPHLEKHNISSLFDVISISSETKLKKPDKEAFEDILRKIGLSAEEVIFIDDQERHVLAAEKIGIKSLVYMDIQNLKEIIES
jgi:HAD superfamily hydrolase (TIGR01509 family)